MKTSSYTVPPFGEAISVSPLITRVTAKNPGPYTFTGTGTYIVGTTDLAVIDPGPDDSDHKQALLSAIDNRPVNAVLVTHTHADHSTAAPWLAENTGSKTYGFGPHGVGRRAGLDGEEVEAGADLSFSPDIKMSDGAKIFGNGWTLKAIHTPGHTSNHMCFHLAEENALFTGDHVMRWATTVISPPDGDMAAYLDSLRKVRDLGADIFYPTHDKPVTKPKAFTRALIGHRKQRERQIYDAIKDGAHDIMEIVMMLYKDVDPRLHLAASRSVFSHIIMMVDENKLAVDGPLRVDSRYFVKE